MVTQVRFYIEGGGDSRGNRDELRRGFRSFLDAIYQVALQRGIPCHSPVLCGSRNSAFGDFKTALRSHPDAFNVLLVDSEAPVTNEPWAHLAARDAWLNPGVADDRCHLMVQSMESWLIADRDALLAYYGQGFNPNPIPGNADVESIDKEIVAAALREATRRTQKGEYHKIKHGAALLGRINHESVRRRARHCDRLFIVMQAVLNAP